MKKTIIIDEDTHNEVIGKILSENLVPGREKVLRIVELLNQHGIIRIKTNDISPNGFPIDVKSMAITDQNGQILKEMSLSELVGMLDSLSEVRRMFKDDEDRKKFLETVIKYWYNGQIEKNGLMPVNFIK